MGATIKQAKSNACTHVLATVFDVDVDALARARASGVVADPLATKTPVQVYCR